MTREMELLLLASRREVMPDAAARLAGLALEPLDWLRIASLASDHHVIPLVAKNLAALANSSVPEPLRNFLIQSAQQTAVRNLALTAELLRVLEEFQKAGIRGLPYKGLICAAMAYGNISLRQFGDLDIVVREAKIESARRILLAMGYATEEDELEFSGRHAPGQYVFWREHSRYLLELHTEKTMRYYPLPLDLEKLEQRARPVALGGREGLTFSPEDTLILLCVHGSKHFWNRLLWIVDIAELSEHTALDWRAAFDRAEEMQCARMVRLGLRLAVDLAGARLPPEILRRVESDRITGGLAKQVQAMLFREAAEEPGAWQRLLFRVRMSDHRWSGLLQTLRLATQATEEDRQAARLPRRLEALYAVARPLHLIGKYGLGFRKRVPADLAPFLATPDAIVERMLAMAEIRPGEVLYDLGCGDGQIVVTAAQRHGIRCVGIEVDARRIAEARERARNAGVERLVTILEQDAKQADVSPADIVTLYLTAPGNLKVWPNLERGLRAGARIVSRDFKMPGWKEEKSEAMEAPGAPPTILYLWRIGEQYGAENAAAPGMAVDVDMNKNTGRG
jgi:hypothetical protein